jgi:hypothetical protein
MWQLRSLLKSEDDEFAGHIKIFLSSFQLNYYSAIDLQQPWFQLHLRLSTTQRIV